jgi:hypothetical protein
MFNHKKETVMNKIKTKESIGKIVKYVRELSIVIIGVAVTLYVSDRVGTKKEKKDLNLQLAVIYMELESNLERLDDIIDYYEKTNHLRRTIMENIDNLQQANDSISGFGSVSSFNYKKGAYEMFINSGAMKLFTDRKLLLDITECYILLENAQKSTLAYNEAKTRELSKAYDMDTKTLLKNIDMAAPQWRSIVNFYITTSGFEGSAKSAKKQIEKTLSLLKTAIPAEAPANR